MSLAVHEYIGPVAFDFGVSAGSGLFTDCTVVLSVPTIFFSLLRRRSLPQVFGMIRSPASPSQVS
jgi:hypothetical protein